MSAEDTHYFEDKLSHLHSLSATKLKVIARLIFDRPDLKSAIPLACKAIKSSKIDNDYIEILMHYLLLHVYGAVLNSLNSYKYGVFHPKTPSESINNETRDSILIILKSQDVAKLYKDKTNLQLAVNILIQCNIGLSEVLASDLHEDLKFAILASINKENR